MITNLDESDGGEQSLLVCPVCGDKYSHRDDVLVRISGEYLCCRDDSGRGGLLIPIHGECGHTWGIGFANHKGYEYVQVFPTLSNIDIGDLNPIPFRRASMREPVVKFYKSTEKGGNGTFATSTTATEPDDFLRECAAEMEAVVTDRAGDLTFTFEALLPQICELWAKLRGYKADGVFERRLLVVGEPMPEAHMTCLNAAGEPAASQLQPA